MLDIVNKTQAWTEICLNYSIIVIKYGIVHRKRMRDGGSTSPQQVSKRTHDSPSSDDTNSDEDRGG